MVRHRRTGYKRKSSPFIWKNKPENETTHFCGYCGKPLEMKHPNQKYCDEWCRNYAYYKRKMERDRKVWEERICTECGKSFIPHTANQLCCSASCSGDRLRTWQRNWWNNNQERLNLRERQTEYRRQVRAKEKAEKIRKQVEEEHALDLIPNKLDNRVHIHY